MNMKQAIILCEWYDMVKMLDNSPFLLIVQKLEEIARTINFWYIFNRIKFWISSPNFSRAENDIKVKRSIMKTGIRFKTKFAVQLQPFSVGTECCGIRPRIFLISEHKLGILTWKMRQTQNIIKKVSNEIVFINYMWSGSISFRVFHSQRNHLFSEPHSCPL